MRDYDHLNLGFHEQQLPPGQNAIMTKNMQKFYLFVKLLIETKRKTGYSTMGIVTGRSGIGKTIAIWAYLNSLKPRAHTGIPACIGIRVKDSSTPRMLVEDIHACFGEHGLERHRYKIADKAAEAIIANDLELLFVDEADRLSVAGFELLRYIFDKTGCPIIIVGLPSIHRVINRHEMFANRAPVCLPFRPPTEQEILSTILPQLVIPRWTFDPKNEKDVAIGQGLWKKVQPSLRELRTMLQLASQLAEMHKAAKITPKILKDVYQMRPSSRHPHPPEESDEEDEVDLPQTEYEIKSEEKQQSREKKQQSEDG